MAAMYYVISMPDGGEPSLDVMTAKELTEHLNEDYYGDAEVRIPEKGFNDLNYRSGLIIIKGEAIKPKAVEKVKQWEV
jgi:hypothetical protein